MRSVDLLIRVVEHHVWLVGEMLDRAANLDEEQVERVEAVAHMRERLVAADPAFVSVVRGFGEDGRLDETFVGDLWNPPEVFTHGGMIAHVLTFAGHRRSLGIGALHDVGITDLGGGDPMRWVAEHA